MWKKRYEILSITDLLRTCLIPVEPFIRVAAAAGSHCQLKQPFCSLPPPSWYLSIPGAIPEQGLGSKDALFCRASLGPLGRFTSILKDLGACQTSHQWGCPGILFSRLYYYIILELACYLRKRCLHTSPFTFPIGCISKALPCFQMLEICTVEETSYLSLWVERWWVLVSGQLCVALVLWVYVVAHLPRWPGFPHHVLNARKKCRNVPTYSTLSLWAEGFIRSQRGELTGHQAERCDLLSPGEYLTDIKSKMHRFLRWPEKNLFSMFLYQMHENGLESRL